MVKKKIGLVTVLFNSDDVLEGFFRSLSIQKFQDFSLYIIDNSPSESSTLLLSELAEKYSIKSLFHVKNSKNNGIAAGNNQGIKMSLSDGTDYTLLLNNDIEFDQPYLLEAIYRKAVEEQQAFVVPKILYYGTKVIWMAGGYISKYKAATFHRGDGKLDNDEYNKESSYRYSPTCFMLINNSIFKSVGLMDESYFVYYDDTDFLYRANKEGYLVRYVPSLVVYHKVSMSTGGMNSPFSVYYMTRNKLKFINKHYKGATKAIANLIALAVSFKCLLIFQRKNKYALIRGVKDALTGR